MKSRLFVLIAFALLAALVLSACSQPLAGGEEPTQPVANEPSPTEEPTMPPTGEPGDNLGIRPPAGVVYIDSVDALILESFPVQVNAVIQGNLADGCTQLAGVNVAGPENNTFTLTVEANRDPDMMCTQALVPFEETVSIPVRDLPAGMYTIVVNDQAQTTFELAVDNTSGDSGGQTEDLAALIAALQAQGLTVKQGDTVHQDFFAVDAQILKVSGEDVQVFEFEDEAAAAAAAGSVSPDGYTITTPDGGVAMVDWISTPHFYQSGRLVVLYVGTDADILAALTAALGPQFAGG